MGSCLAIISKWIYILKSCILFFVGNKERNHKISQTILHPIGIIGAIVCQARRHKQLQKSKEILSIFNTGRCTKLEQIDKKSIVNMLCIES